MIHKGNFSFIDPKCNDGDVFENFNLTQKISGTAVCIGKKGLVFRNGNLVNCAVPSDARIENCNQSSVIFPAEPTEKEMMEAKVALINEKVIEEQARLVVAKAELDAKYPKGGK
jgi:hypothetical protein